MAQEMDTLVCDALMDVGAFPEVAPPPLKGRTCLLGKYYNLPQGQLSIYHLVASQYLIHTLQSIKSSFPMSTVDCG